MYNKNKENSAVEVVEVRKYRKPLDRDHWMSQIQKWTFNIDAEKFYRGYCPFFWMALLCVLLSPITLVLKAIVFVERKFQDFLDRKYFIPRREYRREEERATRDIPLKPSALTMVELDRWLKEGEERGSSDYFSLLNYDWYSTVDSKINWVRIEKWVKENPNWRETHLPQAVIEVDRQKEEAKRAAKNAKAKEVRFRRFTNKVSEFASLIVKPILTVGAVAAIYYLGVFVMYLFQTLTFDIFWNRVLVPVFLASCWGIAIGLAIFVVGWLFKQSGLLRRTISKVWSFIKLTFIFIADIIALTYKAECPLIEWSNETGPIEKIKK